MTGTIAQAAARPALAVLPVLCRTNHGTARSVSALPVTDTTLAARTAASGERSAAAPPGVTAGVGVVGRMGHARSRPSPQQPVSPAGLCPPQPEVASDRQLRGD